MSNSDLETVATPGEGSRGSLQRALFRQACMRCSTNKKKCDRLRPRCTGCTLADALCEQPIRTTDRRLLRQVEEERTELHALRHRVAALELELQRHSSTTMSTLGAVRETLPPLLMKGNRHPILSPAARRFSPYRFLFEHLQQQQPEPVPEQPEIAGEPFDVSELPRETEARDTIRSLLAASKHGPSNLDKMIHIAQLEQDCRLAYRPGDAGPHETAPSRFRCFITVYLAMCMAAAARGENTSMDRKAQACLHFGLKEVSSVLVREDLALTLLSELAVHDSNGPSLWQLLGIATRTALAINLHRRDDIFLPQIFPGWPISMDQDETNQYNQRRKDLFWALYSLDRLCMFVLNRPTTIPDEDIDADLPPSIMLPEGKFSTVSRDALWIHHLQARRLYGQIQRSLHYTPQKQRSLEDLQATTSRFAHQIQQWYMWSRFNATVIPFSDESVKRHVLDDVQYHQMIMALYQPSELVPQVTNTALAALKQSASLSLDLFHHSASRNQLNIHWVNLHHAFVSCAILLYCYGQYRTRSDLVADGRDEVAIKISRCFEVLSLFRGVGPIKDEYEHILQQLVRDLDERPEITLPPEVSYLGASEQLLEPAFDFDVANIFAGMRNGGGASRVGDSGADAGGDQTDMLLPDFWTAVGQNDWSDKSFGIGFPQ